MTMVLSLMSDQRDKGQPKAEIKLDFSLDSKMIRRFDVDRDGELSLPEFQNAIVAQLRIAASSARHESRTLREGDLSNFKAGLVAPFRTFDLNANGSVNITEMRNAIARQTSRGKQP